ncbi:hypothetical protein NH340_JMT00096 [Sarcoptes scabiei]|nr:hypothetical protein NH340_JMT00096 [Sarcoptes scabiei]
MMMKNFNPFNFSLLYPQPNDGQNLNQIQIKQSSYVSTKKIEYKTIESRNNGNRQPPPPLSSSTSSLNTSNNHFNYLQSGLMPFDAQKFQWSELNAFLQYIFAQSNASIQEKFNYLLYMFRMNPQALNLLRNIDSSKPDCLAKALSILNASYNCYESRETNDLLTRIKTAELNFEQASSWDQLLMLALKVKFETNPQTISIYTKQLILRLPDFMFEDPNSPYSLDNLIKIRFNLIVQVTSNRMVHVTSNLMA